MATRMGSHVLSPLPLFDVTSARASHAWPKWKTAFEYYIVAAGITDDAVKRATLLHCVGPDVQQLFSTLKGGTNYESAMTALTSHFEPKRNVVFERHTFRQCDHRNGETNDEYYMRLKTLASTCNFGQGEDDHIRDQIIYKCTSTSLRRRLLREIDIKLVDLLSIARAAEAADRQASAMESKNAPSTSFHEAPVNEMTARQQYPPPADRRDQ